MLIYIYTYIYIYIYIHIYIYIYNLVSKDYNLNYMKLQLNTGTSQFCLFLRSKIIYKIN